MTERQPIPLAIRTRPIHKLLHKKLRISQRVVQPVLSAAKTAGRREQVRLRRQLAEELLAAGPPALTPPPAKGYRLCAPDEIPGMREIAALGAETYEKKRPSLSAEYAATTKRPFLVNLTEEADRVEHPEFIRFAISHAVLDPAIAYLGTVPLLTGVNVLWTPVNETVKSSQLYHYDDEDLTQFKLFIACKDVGEDQGPLTFLPADASQHVRHGFRTPIGRVTDEQVERAGVADEAVRLVGPAGSGTFLDTSRCLHYGSRENRRVRIVIQIQFLRYDAPTESTAGFRLSPALRNMDLDPLQKLALAVA